MQTGSPRPTAAPTRFTSFAPAAVPLPLTASGPQPPQDQDQAAGNRPGNGPAKRSRERDDGHPASALAQRARTAAHDQKGVASAAAGPRPTLRLLLDTTGPTPTGLRGTGQPAPTLLDIPPQHRSEADYRAWFRAGRTLAQIPVEQRDELCCRIAIEHAPRALAEVPEVLRSVALCEAAVRRDGLALADVPDAHLEAEEEVRMRLCQLAYDSPRPPRIGDVPGDLLTEARCLQSLRWAPGDLRHIPDALLTPRVCLAVIRLLPPEFPIWPGDIPVQACDEQVARALIQRGKHSPSIFREDLLAWLPPKARTDQVLQDFLLAYPRELHEKQWFKGPASLSLLAQIVETHPEGLRRLPSTRAIANLLLEAATAEGLAPGQALPADRWAPGLLPPDLSPQQVMRWAIAHSPRPSLDDIPEALRDDEALCAQVLRRGDLQEITRMKPGVVARHADVLALRARQEPDLLPLMPASVYRHLDQAWIQKVCRDYLAKAPRSPVLDHIDRHGQHGLWHEELRKFNNRYALAMPADAASASTAGLPSLSTLNEGELTLERCQQAVARQGRQYLFVPERHRSWPLLRTALRTEPDLLHLLPEREVTPTVALQAMLEAGLFPENIPAHARETPSFMTAFRRLPPRHFRPQALAAAIVDFPDGPVPDAMTTAWIERLIGQDSRRLIEMPRWFKSEWAVRAYRLGASFKQIQMRLDPGEVPDFLAAIGPFTEAVDELALARHPAVAASSSIASASAASAASAASSAAAARPS